MNQLYYVINYFLIIFNVLCNYPKIRHDGYYRKFFMNALDTWFTAPDPHGAAAARGRHHRPRSSHTIQAAWTCCGPGRRRGARPLAPGLLETTANKRRRTARSNHRRHEDLTWKTLPMRKEKNHRRQPANLHYIRCVFTTPSGDLQEE